MRIDPPKTCFDRGAFLAWTLQEFSMFFSKILAISPTLFVAHRR